MAYTTAVFPYGHDTQLVFLCTSVDYTHARTFYGLWTLFGITWVSRYQNQSATNAKNDYCDEQTDRSAEKCYTSCNRMQ